MDVEDERPALVMDSGSRTFRVGFAGEDAPRVVIPMLHGIPRSLERKASLQLQDYYVGNDAEGKRDVLSMRRPMQRGVVTDWEAMQHVWEFGFQTLNVRSEDQPVLMSTPSFSPPANRERMAQIVFEHFEVPAFHVINDSVLSLFTTGRHMGMVIDVGDGVTRIMPIQGLHPEMASIRQAHLGGFDLTCYLQELLEDRGYSFEGHTGLETVAEMKESLCYVADDLESEKAKAGSPETMEAVEKSYQLPDGSTISVKDERFMVPEALFNPSLMGRQEPGIHQLIHSSVMSVPQDSRGDFYCNFLISGATTLLRGFADRLQEEMALLLPSTKRYKVVAAPERAYAAWIGGSILASLSTFQSQWLTRQQYQEYGPTIVHRNCF